MIGSLALMVNIDHNKPAWYDLYMKHYGHKTVGFNGNVAAFPKHYDWSATVTDNSGKSMVVSFRAIKMSENGLRGAAAQVVPTAVRIVDIQCWGLSRKGGIND